MPQPVAVPTKGTEPPVDRLKSYSMISTGTIVPYGNLYILIIDTYIKTPIFLSPVSLSDFIAGFHRKGDRQLHQRERERENLGLENYIGDSVYY